MLPQLCPASARSCPVDLFWPQHSDSSLILGGLLVSQLHKTAHDDAHGDRPLGCTGGYDSSSSSLPIAKRTSNIERHQGPDSPMARRKPIPEPRRQLHGFACPNCGSERVRLGTVKLAALELRCDACGYVWSHAQRRPLLPKRRQ